MDILQTLDAEPPFCVTLNQTERIEPTRVLRGMTYSHPIYSPEALMAQQRHNEISGVNRTHYCGAYWGNGFHEDGVNSALAVCAYFGKGLDNA
jgi:predicted NAD/FAD-binding protein